MCVRIAKPSRRGEMARGPESHCWLRGKDWPRARPGGTLEETEKASTRAESPLLGKETRSLWVP